MSSLSFIHLSDIHFVKISGNPADIDRDLREAIVTDIRLNAKDSLCCVDGVLVSGDIAFSGNVDEYDKAKLFLKEVTDVLGIEESSVYCVPGNHDVDRNIPKESEEVYNAQCKLDQAENLDAADKVFESKITNKHYNDILFKTTQAYNDFASGFECNTNTEMICWEHYFPLDNGLKLKIHGMNSCFISNADDKCDADKRPMYIGQAQIPRREDNTIVLLMCHHPPDFWKYQNDILDKVNKRADIQLFGHKHEPLVNLTDNNVVITSGATHPVRGNDWNPKYNWLTIESVIIDDKRAIQTTIYPRKLDQTRDRFEADIDLCKGEKSTLHTIYIDEKRKSDLTDQYIKPQEKSDKPNEDEARFEVSHRELVYKFFDLSYVKQTEILIELDLLDEDDRQERYRNIIKKILRKAKEYNKLNDLWNRVSN